MVIGDNATAGLGINSGCIQVDATMNYTLAFRVAAASTGIAFPPRLPLLLRSRIAPKRIDITSVSTNARVLTPANYAGDSNAGRQRRRTGRARNASLTYNNGITCNCNVTGADWNVATANLWTRREITRSRSACRMRTQAPQPIAHSMRVFILENTAANPNQILRGRYRA